MASTGSDEEVGIGLLLLASLGDGDSDDDFEEGIRMQAQVRHMDLGTTGRLWLLGQ